MLMHICLLFAIPNYHKTKKIIQRSQINMVKSHPYQLLKGEKIITQHPQYLNPPTINWSDIVSINLTHLSLASLLWDKGKQYSPRWDAAKRGVPSGAILFAQRNFIEKLDKTEWLLPVNW